MLPSVWLAGLAMGLFGSAHCVAMCGGIASVLGGGIAPDLRRRGPTHLAYVVLYNTGRVSSYALSGAVLGLLALELRGTIAEAQAVLRVVAGVLTFGLGLYLAGWLPAFARIERLGAPLWKRLAPTAGKLLPVRSPASAFFLGALWGWVPCGMVYSALALASAADGPLEGAATMMAFGLGTLPAMIGVGTFAGQALSGMRRGTWVRRAAGIGLAAVATLSLLRAGAALRSRAVEGPSPTSCHGH